MCVGPASSPSSTFLPPRPGAPLATQPTSHPGQPLQRTQWDTVLTAYAGRLEGGVIGRVEDVLGAWAAAGPALRTGDGACALMGVLDEWDVPATVVRAVWRYAWDVLGLRCPHFAERVLASLEVVDADRCGRPKRAGGVDGEMENTQNVEGCAHACALHFPPVQSLPCRTAWWRSTTTSGRRTRAR